MNYERSETSERKRRWVLDMNQLPEIEVLESEEFWSQRAIDTPEVVLQEIQRLKQQQPDPDVNQ